MAIKTTLTVWTKRQQKAHRKQLVKALRSGEYKQARGQLHNSKIGRMCCLGVACDISGLGKWDGDTFHTGGFFDSAELPPNVRSWLGFTDTDGTYMDTSLTYKNDSGASFKQIADIIEREPGGLVSK